MGDNLFAAARFGTTPGLFLQTIYNDDESQSFKKEQLISLITSKSNVDYLTNLIISRSDPLRNGASLNNVKTIADKVTQLLASWKNIGKFDKDEVTFEGKRYVIKTVSPTSLVDHYNLEFMKAFAESILPTSDVAKVTSVVNPNGLYAQQERVIKVNSKPVPFYEKALYRRLTDRTLDQRIDETEIPFYRMDHNPRMTDAERKKRDVDRTQQPTYMDREGLSYRMKPKY